MPNKVYEVVCWDWKAQPDWDEINTLIQKGFTHINFGIKTCADFYAIVLTKKEVTHAKAQSAFERWDNGPPSPF